MKSCYELYKIINQVSGKKCDEYFGHLLYPPQIYAYNVYTPPKVISSVEAMKTILKPL